MGTMATKRVSGATYLSTRAASFDDPGPLATFAARAFVVLATVVHFQVFPHPPAFAYLLAPLPIGVVLLLPKAAVMRMHVSVPPLLIAGWIFLSSSWTFDPDRTGFLIRVELPILAGFLIISAVLDNRLLMRMFLWAGRLALLITIAATVIIPSSRTGEQLDSIVLPGWHGLFPHKNDMGMFFAIFLAMVLVADRNRLTRYPTVLLTTALLVGSQSITALSTALVVVAAYVWLQANKKVDDRVLSITVVSTVALAVGAAVGLRAGLGERPWLGYGRGGLFFSPPNELSLELWRKIGFRAPNSRNGTLDLVSQIGLIGLGLYLTILTQTIRSATRSYRRRETAGTFALVAIAAMVVASLSEPAFLGPYLTLLCAIRIMTLRLDRENDLAVLRRIAEAEPKKRSIRPRLFHRAAEVN